MSLAGCAASQTTRRPGAAEVEVVEVHDELGERINDFVDYFRTTVERAAMDIERKSESKEHRRAAALWRVRMVSECRVVVDEPDFREALLDLWPLCQAMLDYFTTGQGKSLFGDHQEIAAEAATEIHTAFEGLARQFISPDSFEAVRTQVMAYAREHPIQGEFSGRPAEDLSDQNEGAKLLGAIVSVPFAPLTALGGISKTPASVRDVSHSMDRFTDAFEDFPSSARWQLQLLAMNLEEMQTVSDTLGSVKQFSDSSARFVQVVDDMPHKVREEAEVLLKTVEDSQPHLQTTLREAQKTAKDVQGASQDIRETVVSVEHVVSDVQESAVALESAADAVTATAKEILKFVPASMKDETGQISGRSRDPEVKGHSEAVPAYPAATTTAPATQTGPARNTSFSFQAVTESANSLGDTTVELRGLLADLQALLNTQSLSRESNALTASFEGLVDYMAKRLALLLLLSFTLALIYTVVRVRLQRSNQLPAGVRNRLPE
ncbi:MAG: hypothetical protein JXA69_16425 [Phycisphaerae bacterium]|nr:hypothetical protein [Phycisphaerae bacterium]